MTSIIFITLIGFCAAIIQTTGGFGFGSLFRTDRFNDRCLPVCNFYFNYHLYVFTNLNYY